MDPLAVANGQGSREPQFSRHEVVCEVALAHEHRHGEHLETLYEVEGVVELRFLFPEGGSDFRELVQPPKSKRELVDRPGGIGAQVRAMADEENCGLGQRERPKWV